MSSREHICWECGETWHCDGCDTSEISTICDLCSFDADRKEYKEELNE